MNRRIIAFSSVALGLALGACSGGDKPAVQAAGTIAPAPVAVWDTREHVGKAIELLNQGKPDLARRELTDVLHHAPADPVARSLYNQLDPDPKTVLGTINYPYKVKSGETMSELAQRFLGDPLQFYILARYNDIAAPGGVTGGQTLLIPGKPKPAPVAREETRRPSTAKTPPSAPAASPASAAVRDPARATRLRGAALEQMNKGAIDRAVGLLRQAQSLDPDNPLIKRDLDRAVRISSTVHARR